MWHIEGFDARGDAAQLAGWLQTEFLPYFRAQGFSVRVFVTAASLGPRQFWLATEMDGFGDIDSWAARAGERGAELISSLLTRVDRMQGGVVTELWTAGR
jgi:hypothetical protein